MGADLVPCRQRHRAAVVRLAGGRDGAQEFFHAVHRADLRLLLLPAASPLRCRC